MCSEGETAHFRDRIHLAISGIDSPNGDDYHWMPQLLLSFSLQSYFVQLVLGKMFGSQIGLAALLGVMTTHFNMLSNLESTQHFTYTVRLGPSSP